MSSNHDSLNSVEAFSHNRVHTKTLPSILNDDRLSFLIEAQSIYFKRPRLITQLFPQLQYLRVFFYKSIGSIVTMLVNSQIRFVAKFMEVINTVWLNNKAA